MNKMMLLALCLMLAASCALGEAGGAYVTPLSGATVTLPHGWSVTERHDEELATATFMTGMPGVMQLTCSTTDIFPGADEALRMGLGQDSFHALEISAFTGVPAEALAEQEIMGRTYYLCGATAQAQSGEEMSVVYAFHVDMGYLYAYTLATVRSDAPDTTPLTILLQGMLYTP